MIVTPSPACQAARGSRKAKDTRTSGNQGTCMQAMVKQFTPGTWFIL
jgi:hypothetical protein